AALPPPVHALQVRLRRGRRRRRGRVARHVRRQRHGTAAQPAPPWARRRLVRHPEGHAAHHQARSPARGGAVRGRRRREVHPASALTPATGPGRGQTCLADLMTTGSSGTFWCGPLVPVFTCSIFRTTSIPSTTLPKTA